MNLHPRLPERSHDGGKKVPEAAPMFRGLFNSPLSLKIHNQALLTIFITGMAQGTLPLDQYRAFQAQDAVYFQKVATLYGNAAQEMLERENFVFADFYSIQSTKFLKLHKDFVDDKNPKNLTWIKWVTHSNHICGSKVKKNPRALQWPCYCVVCCVLSWQNPLQRGFCRC